MRFLLLLPVLAFAQAPPETAWDKRKNGVPTSGCSSLQDVGKRYSRINAAAANATLYVCSNTAASTYAWALVGAGGGALSVFGRTGAVVAVSGDYTAAQVTNAADTSSTYSNPAWITALVATKLTGLVPVANLGTGAASSTTCLYGDQTYKACTGSDFVTTKSSATILAITAGSGRLGATISTIAASTATLSGSSASGTAYIYLDSSGVLTVGHNAATTVTCTVCTVATGVTAFPSDGIPISTATFTANVWDTSGISDKRVNLSSKVIRAGSNVTVVNNADGSDTVSASGGGTTVAANPPYITVSGVNYIPQGMFAATVPSTSGWTKVGAASGTLVASGAAIIATGVPAASANVIWTKSLPGGGDQITFAFQTELTGRTLNPSAGVGFRNSSTGAMLWCYSIALAGEGYQLGSFGCDRYSGINTYVTAVSDLLPVAQNPMYVRISKAAGTVTIQTSINGLTWNAFDTMAEADTGTLDQYFFGVAPSTAGGTNPSITMLSVKEN